MKEGRQSECEKAIPEWAPLHGSDWLAMGHTSKANIPEISVFCPSCHHVVGAMNNKELGLWCRRGLLAYVYNGCLCLNECLSGGKWPLYSTALWPWPSRSDSTDNSYTNNLGRSVVNSKSEVEIEYAERRVVTSGKKKKKKKYGVVIKSFVLHKKKDRTYRCGEAKCNEIFDSIQERSEHIRKKHGMKVRKCKHCGARCKTKWGFKKTHGASW